MNSASGLFSSKHKLREQVTTYLSTFTITYGGHNDIIDYEKIRRHQSAEKKISNYLKNVKKTLPKDNDLMHVATEISFMYHCAA